MVKNLLKYLLLKATNQGISHIESIMKLVYDIYNRQAHMYSLYTIAVAYFVDRRRRM